MALICKDPGNPNCACDLCKCEAKVRKAERALRVPSNEELKTIAAEKMARQVEKWKAEGGLKHVWAIPKELREGQRAGKEEI